MNSDRRRPTRWDIKPVVINTFWTLCAIALVWLAASDFLAWP